ncbi:MAG TPA: YciI family protein [Propionibacteriaceae bacterium]
MTEWIYFLHPPRDDFAATMTEEERAAFAEHAAWLARLMDDGVLILAGPTGGAVNTGIGIFEAPDEETARRIIAEDPVARDGFAKPELRPYQVGFLRSRQ